MDWTCFRNLYHTDDTIISRQYYGYAWRNSSSWCNENRFHFNNRWLGPFNPISSVAALSPGNYFADVFINARFANAEIEHPQRIQITIFDTSQVRVEKPNIYLSANYTQPVRHIGISDGRIHSSISAIVFQWLECERGTIRKINQQYDYLFYESKNPMHINMIQVG